MRKNRLFRMGCFLFGGLFFTLSQVWAVNNDAVEINSSVQPSSIEQLLNLEIPSGWGIVKDSYNSGTNKLVVNIQDAHCDFEAQKNIANILSRLATNYNLKVIAIEGAAGKVENPLLANFPEKKVRENVSLYLVRQGKLTGAEYFAVNSDQNLKLFGVEDLRLYMDNLDAFQQAQPFKTEAKQYFSILKDSLDVLKQSIYNDNLKKLDILDNDYSSRKISFDKYAVELYKMVEESGLRKVNYPTFFELQNTIKLELKVDFQKADTERMQLITALTQIIEDKETISQLIGKSLSFKKGMLSAGEFANFIKDLAFDLKLNMGAYPNFNAYADYITKYEEVANEKLFLEIKDITKNLKKVFYTDDDQKQLDVLYRHLDVLVKLVDLKMVNEDMVYFFENRGQISMNSFTKFIEPQAYKHKAIVSLPAGIAYVDAYMPAWAKFYELADSRDTAFIEKTLFHMENEKTDYAALITGGFHTKQLTRLLKEKKISYIVIAPKASLNDANPYFNIMQGGQSPIESFVSQMQSTLGVFRGADQESLDKVSPLAQNTLKDMAKTEHQVTTLALAVEFFGMIAANNPDAKDKDIQEQVIKVFETMKQAGTDIDMDYIKPLIGQMIQQGASILVKSEDKNINAMLVFNPQETNLDAKITVASSVDFQSKEAVLGSQTTDKAEKTGISASIDNIIGRASAKEVLKAVLNTSTAKNSTVRLDPVKASMIVEKVVITLAEIGIVDAEKVSGELQKQSELFKGDMKKLEATVKDVVAITVAVILQKSPLASQAADIIVQDTGLSIPVDKQEKAQQIIKNNISDTGKITVELNKEGIDVNEKQVDVAVKNGLAETSKASANSEDIIANVVVSKLGIQNKDQKKAIEIVKKAATSSADVITANLKKEGITVNAEQVSQALNQGLLQANAAAIPITSGISSTSYLSTKEQESVIASQIEGSDVRNMQKIAEAFQGVELEQGFVQQGAQKDEKILSIIDKAGISRDKVNFIRVDSGKYKDGASVSVNIKPSAHSPGKLSIVISPKRSDTEISKSKTTVALLSGMMEKQMDVLSEDSKLSTSQISDIVLGIQSGRVKEELKDFQTTNITDSSLADSAPKIKEKNGIFVPLSAIFEIVSSEKNENGEVKLRVKSVVKEGMWDAVGINNDIFIMNDLSKDNVTVSVADIARVMDVEESAVTFIGPLDIGEMQGEKIGLQSKVSPSASYQFVEKSGTKLKSACFITEEGSEANGDVQQMIRSGNTDAKISVVNYIKPGEKQLVKLNICLAEAVHSIMYGKTGIASQSEKDEAIFFVQAVLGDPELIKDVIKDIESGQNYFGSQFESTSKLTTTELDAEYLTVYVAAATYA